MSDYPLIVSAYSIGTPYEEEAKRLENSLKRHDLRYVIYPFESTGSWEANCATKPMHILRAMMEEQGPVCWLDADAEVVQHPVLLKTLTCDFACYRGPVWGQGIVETLSGTVFANATHAGYRLIEVWAELCGHNTQKWDQRHLETLIINESRRADIGDLPREYCQIVGAVESGTPVILHHQASRNMRPWIRRIGRTVDAEKAKQVEAKAATEAPPEAEDPPDPGYGAAVRPVVVACAGMSAKAVDPFEAGLPVAVVSTAIRLYADSMTSDQAMWYLTDPDNGQYGAEGTRAYADPSLLKFVPQTKMRTDHDLTANVHVVPVASCSHRIMRNTGRDILDGKLPLFSSPLSLYFTLQHLVYLGFTDMILTGVDFRLNEHNFEHAWSNKSLANPADRSRRQLLLSKSFDTMREYIEAGRRHGITFRHNSPGGRAHQIMPIWKGSAHASTADSP